MAIDCRSMSAMGTYTMNGADWSKRYPLIVGDALRLKTPPSLMLRSFGLARMVWLISKRCLVGSMMGASSGDLSNEPAPCVASMLHGAAEIGKPLENNENRLQHMQHSLAPHRRRAKTVLFLIQSVVPGCHS